MRRATWHLLVACLAVCSTIGAFGRPAATTTRHLVAEPNASAPVTPKPGYMKAEIWFVTALPNASSPAELATQVPFDIVEEYGQVYYAARSWIVSVSESAFDRLRTFALAVNMSVGDRSYYDYVRLYSWTDTRYPLAEPTRGLPSLSLRPGEKDLYVVQFHSPQKAEWLRAVSGSGAVLVTAFDHNACVLLATPEEFDFVRGLNFVQWSTPLHPYLKPAPLPQEFWGGRAEVDITLAPNADTDALCRRFGLTQWGIGSGSSHAFGAITQTTADELLRERSVAAIRATHPPTSGPPPSPPPSGPPVVGIPSLRRTTLILLLIAVLAIAIRRIA